MARRKSDGSVFTIILVMIVSAISSTMEWVKTHQELVLGIFGLIISYYIIKFLWNRRKYKKWVNYLKQKYNNDMEIVGAILNGEFWKGQSSEQLLDALGSPSAIDKQVLKTKTKEVWKYHKKKKDQYALKIMLEKGEVVGWDMKG
jgi:hypothetical protein